MSTTHPYRLGRIPSPPHERARNLQLAAYFERLPVAPETCDYGDLVTDWPMYLNDRLGDCTAAGAGHLEELWSAEVDGHPAEVTDQDVLDFYELQGYRPDDPDSDRGADMLSVLRAWRRQGIGGHHILAFAEVDAKDRAQIEAALWLFSGLYVGVQLPRSAMEQFQAGEPWEVVEDDGGILGGHCIVAVAYDPQGVTFISWGRPVRASWEWWDAYAMGQEVYACIPDDDERLSGRALPNGFKLDQLKADLRALGGRA